ncbi:MAG: 2-phosphoglycerate kinase Pgk [Candidatus Methanohalarchaeum thermophilum]|uniref:2-phosphoglycerate kinase Pgk n=1 Tax=Methanohalarchaeum thermophilum TaxID=1903181 RepID=A0A1Q6DSC3_METT1|nr:MAG: 2-phosphoglycerate kinase Pgk [Candidatus Methanohalarchaeum thermophilum]
MHESYEIVQKIKRQLEKEKTEVISSEKLRKKVINELLSRGFEKEEKFYRVRHEIKNLDKPIFILIGGGTGVGKSTIALDIGHRLDINRVIGSDQVREIMRSILSPNLVPTLHQSSFKAKDKIRTPFRDNKLIYGFREQTSIVNEGLAAVMKRGEKEGLNMILNGVHIIPGFLERTMKKLPEHTFRYILDVPDKQQHIQHFYTREEGSKRKPNRYINELEDIREIHNHILEMAKEKNVKIVENTDYEESLRTILEDIIEKLEKKI